MFNEIDGDFEDVAVNTFKLGLPAKHSLRKSLTGKPVTSTRQLMDRTDKYKRIEENQQHDKGRERLSIKRGGILGRTAIIITDPKEISLHNLGSQTLKR